MHSRDYGASGHLDRNFRDCRRCSVGCQLPELLVPPSGLEPPHMV